MDQIQIRLEILFHGQEMGAEDFSYLLEKRPGAYLFLGIGDAAGLHNTNYDFNDFATLDGNDVLVRHNDKFIEGYDNRVLPETKKKIDKCRSLKSCEQLKNHPECGYCGTTNKFDYQMGGKIAPDVFPKHKTRGNMWTQGTPAVYDCKKMKEQLLCDTVKNCTAMEEGSKIAKLCGWCPGDSKPKVKNEAKVLKYENGNEPHPTLVSGDICPDLNVKMPEELGGGVWFSELITAGLEFL